MRAGTSLFAPLALLAAAMLVAAGCTAAPPTNQTVTTTTTPAGTGTPAITPAGNATPTMNATANVTPSGTAPSLTNTTWQWNALEVAANRTVVNDPAQYTVVFQPNGTYNLKADCNTGRGTYTVSGSELNLSPAAVTLAYCGEASQDQLYLTSLMRVSSYEVDSSGNLLLNIREPVSRMVFSAANASANVSAPFVGATWRWIARSGSESIQVPSPDRYTMAFNASGTYDIKADCNVGSGTYTVDGTKVRIFPGPLTMAYCGDQSLDSTYLTSLYRVTSYSMDPSGRLVLMMISPNERLTFEKVA